MEQMNIVIVGHVDHGKSTVIGRLLADTDSLPKGKLDQVRANCERNAKPFEYAFLLDALKDEQDQGITIDSARCFFKTDKRHYIVIDAPGHIEFLKNMISGAARAEAALLVIDADEGVQENSRRHGFMTSLLGIKQLVVLVNKMDLVNYDEARYNEVVNSYRDFLASIGVESMAFVPISAREGDNLVGTSSNTPWYTGPSVLETIDAFQKEKEKTDQPFRMPVQGVYKFTDQGDDRRIVAGTIETGEIAVGDEVVFYPSGKSSRVKSIEVFNWPLQPSAHAGQAIGMTLDTQIYVKAGELMCKKSDAQVQTGTHIKANIFWLGKKPMVKDKKYKLKIASTRAMGYLQDIHSVMDASNLALDKEKNFIGRHDVAECTIALQHPIPFDLAGDAEATSRFVIVDDYEIAGGGIVVDAVESEQSVSERYIQQRDFVYVNSVISSAQRAERHHQKSQFIVIAGPPNSGKLELSKALEEELFVAGRSVYYLGISNLLTHDPTHKGLIEQRDDHIRRLGDMAHFMCDAGKIFISTISDLDDFEAEVLRDMAAPYDMVIVNVGENRFTRVSVDCQLDVASLASEQAKHIREFLVGRAVLV